MLFFYFLNPFLFFGSHYMLSIWLYKEVDWLIEPKAVQVYYTAKGRGVLNCFVIRVLLLINWWRNNQNQSQK